MADMRAGWVGCAMLVAACSDPSIQVHFEVPEAYRSDIEAVSLQVLVPPVAGLFDCDDVAFGEVDPDEVNLATVQRVLTRETGDVDLSGIPRLGTKLFLIQGLDAMETPLVAACGEVGEITGADELDLVGEPTALVAFPPSDPGAPPPAEFMVIVADSRGDVLGDIETRWTVTGPADEITSGATRTEANGRAMITPLTPTLPGPVAVDVRPRWVRGTPDTLLAFTAPPAVFEATLPGDVDGDLSVSTEALYRVGRLGPNGEMGVAALGPSSSPVTVGRSVFIAYYDPQVSPPFRTATSARIPNSWALGMISIGERDQLFTITGSAWIDVSPTGALTSLAAPSPGNAALLIAESGSCDGPSSEILAVFADDSVRTLGPGGTVADSPFDEESTTSRLLGTGCVSASDGQDYRIAAYSESNLQVRVIAEMDEPRSGGATVLPTGIGFTPALGSDPPYLLGTELSITGAEIVRYRLLALGARILGLEEVGRDATPTVPVSTAGGDFDSDGELDVAALIQVGESDRGTQFRTLMALEVDHAGHRLLGMSARTEARRPRTWAADFDGDGFDELVVATPQSFGVLRFAP